MLAPILILGVLAAGPLKIRVEVIEYAPGSKSVPGAKVTLRETAEPYPGASIAMSWPEVE